MIAIAVQTLIDVVLPLGVWGVFLASLIEEIVAPIPSSIVQMASGFIFLEGDFSARLLLDMFLYISLPASFGVTIGSLPVYFLSYYYGKVVVDGWGKYLGISWSEIEKAEKRFSKGYRDEMTLFFIRNIPVVPSVAITAFCGLIRFNFKNYIIYTFLGTIIRSSILAILGWKVGGIYNQYAEQVSNYETIVLGGLFLIISSFVIYRYHYKNRIKKI